MVFDDVGADTVKELIPALNQFNANMAYLTQTIHNAVDVVGTMAAEMAKMREQLTIIVNKLNRIQIALHVDVPR